VAGRIFRCQIVDVKRIGGGIVLLRFSPQIAFDFEPGQFVSLQVPNKDNPEEMLWRAYSLANPLEMARRHGYELCIRQVPGGQAGAYLDKLKPGNWINVRAAYGEFTLRTRAGRGVCLIGTGTGIAPLRSIALSEKIQRADVAFAVAILGFRSFEEIPYAGEFERAGVATTYALSRAEEKLEFPFYKGRVTDVLRNLKPDFPWANTDFYMCGNGEMIRDAIRILQSGHGVKDDAIVAEAFEPASKQKQVA